MQAGPGKVSGLLGIIACVLVIVHVLLALIIVTDPDASNGRKVLTFYRRLIVLGPFFQEPRIVTAPHLLVSLRVDGTWTTAHDYGCSDVEATGASYRAVRARAFEEFLGGQVAERKPLDRESRVVRELENYLRARVHDSRADSVAVAYVLQRVTPQQDGIAADTVFHLKFKP